MTATRRTFLKGSGLGAGAILLNPSAAEAATGPYRLQNNYFRVSGAWGKLTEIAVDVNGRGRWATLSPIRDLYLGQHDVYDESWGASVQWTATDDRLRLTDIPVPGDDYKVEQGGNNGAPAEIEPGHTLGQSFTADTGAQISSITMLLATHGATGSAITATLYRGTPDTTLEQVSSARLDPVNDNTAHSIEFAPQPGGAYYLELSEPDSSVTWWWHAGDPADVGGGAYQDRTPITTTNFVFTASGYLDGGKAEWTFALDGNRLRATHTIDTGITAVVPWVRDGYSVAYADGVPFSRFYTNRGQLMPAQQLKRRPSWGTFGIGPAESIYATGTGSYDVRISSPAIEISGSSPIDAEQMPLQLSGGDTYIIDLLPHTDELPREFPEFVASDTRRAVQLTTFFHERTLSAQQGAQATNGADWKDWTGRIYDWLPNGFRGGERESLLGIKLDDDGYVWTWNPNGAREWPFPDPSVWDTRHFTTNPMYVLGAWRYFSWTGDEDFLATMLPRVRKAMTYCLDVLDGRSGLLTLPSLDHGGRPQEIGSNYWDITPFGHLDAYANAYFYGAIEATAQLEEHVSGSTAPWRELKGLVRRRFNDVFWDDVAGRYICCVDIDGTRHDYGAAFVNLEAASFGLATREQVERIYGWLEHGHTELTTNVVFVPTGDGVTTLEPGQSLSQSFSAPAPFAQVAGSFAATALDNAGFTLSLYRGDQLIASRQLDWRPPAGWGHLDLPVQPAGDYRLEMSGGDGRTGWFNGTSGRSLVAVSPYANGAADIYTRFGWAPRATSRKNNFWYFWGWAGVTLPFEQQLQDGGTDLYLSGFDVEVRAKHRSADDAWRRLTAIADRWAKPDHLCGGDPLHAGEHPQNESTPGSVGVDIPFPESGLATGSFLYAFVGAQAEPSGLVITPNLPSTLSYAGVRRMHWRGRTVDLTVTRDTVIVRGDGISVRKRYSAGESVRISPP